MAGPRLSFVVEVVVLPGVSFALASDLPLSVLLLVRHGFAGLESDPEVRSPVDLASVVHPAHLATAGHVGETPFSDLPSRYAHLG